MSDWATLPLGQVVTFQRGYDLPHRARKSGEIPIVSSAGVSDFHDVAMVDPPGVVTGRYGTIGELFLISEPFWPLNTTLYVRDFHGNDPRFIYYLLQRFDFASFSGKSGVPGVNRNDLHVETVAVPTNLPEQRAIAAALSDVDALLDGLDRFLAKKRDLKQAAMQQLLTGQTRLPSFHGEWQMKRLGEIGQFLKGRGVKRDDADSGALACVRYGEIYTTHQDYVRTFHSRISAEVAATATRLEYGDLLFAGSGETKEEIGKCVAFVSETEAYAGGDIVILRPSNGDPLFFGYALNMPAIARQKASFGQGDAVVHISAAALADVSVGVPSIEEQTAIAIVVSDIDAEIGALEARREKTRHLKQAMMQELLTGKTRLVPPEVAHA